MHGVLYSITKASVEDGGVIVSSNLIAIVQVASLRNTQDIMKTVKAVHIAAANAMIVLSTTMTGAKLGKVEVDITATGLGVEVLEDMAREVRDTTNSFTL